MSTTTAGRSVTLGGIKGLTTRRVFELGGFVAGAILIAFGVVAIAMGVNGRSTVRDSLALEKIVGSDNMTVTDVKKEAADAGLTGITFPKKDLAGQEIDTGAEAKVFAEYMRIHTLESTGGLTYAELGRYSTPDGNPAGTSDPSKAATDENGAPVSNSARNLWVTETALTTALNMSFMAEQLALFGTVVGVALLLSGIGFIVLAYAALHRRRAS